MTNKGGTTRFALVPLEGRETFLFWTLKEVQDGQNQGLKM